MLKVVYLVPNTADPAVKRRVGMLRRGRAEVVVAGFRRDGTERPELGASGYFELGETFDADFSQRIRAVIGACRSIRKRLAGIEPPDLILARNLEMLAVANALAGAWPDRPAIGYECLDIHRLMLRPDAVGYLLRATERHLARSAAFVIVSSPGFTEHYFEAYRQLSLPILLVENRVPDPAGARGENPALHRPGDAGPLRIGWFGALRCRKSLAVLSEFSNGMNGSVEIVLRGRPVLTEFDNFLGAVQGQRHLRFEGPYRNPDDLARIYSDVHFAWAIDFFEEGQNSSWLLPNRIYEGCLHGAIPIALDGTQTAAFLRQHGIGIILPDVEQATLRRMIGQLAPERIRELAAAISARSRSVFAFDDSDCQDLVMKLAAFTAGAPVLREAV